MRFKFDANQDYQLQAIAAVVDLFEGQPRVEVDFTALALGPTPAFPNRLDLDMAALLENLQRVQQRNGLPPDDELKTISASVETPDGTAPIEFPNLSVEMETATERRLRDLVHPVYLQAPAAQDAR